jgi:hypothetical protein
MILDYNADSNRIFRESGGVALLCLRLRQEIETSLKEYDKICESLRSAGASMKNRENKNDAKLLSVANTDSHAAPGSGSKRKKSHVTSVDDDKESTPSQRRKSGDGTSVDIVEKATKGEGLTANDVVLPSYVAYSRRVLIKR